MDALTLLLADGRWPGGGYAHSGGVEAAVECGAVTDSASLRSFVAGRLQSVGTVEAWLAAEACSIVTACTIDGATGELARLEQECDARNASPALRAASCSLGRGLRRAATVCWAPLSSCRAEHFPVVLGTVAAVAGLGPEQAARLSVHQSLFGPLASAPKLFAIDMAVVCAIAVSLAPLADAVALDALAAVGSPEPPVWSAPLLEQRAETHARWEVRLFAS